MWYDKYMEVALSPVKEQGLNTSPVEKLHPVEFTDEDGAERQLFTFEDRKGRKVKVVFYTREELPFAPEVVQGNYAVILGEPPKHRDRSEWEEFVKDVKSTSDNKNPLNPSGFSLPDAIAADKTLFLVENTPIHILDLAFYLGLEGSRWREARQKAALDKVYTDEVLNLLDDMIAGTAVGKNGELRQRQNQEGEALATLALLGDKEAREILDDKRRMLEDLDKERLRKQQEFSQKKLEALEKEGVNMPKGNVWATQVTGYRPQVTENGILVRSSFDGTGGVMTRGTVHFTLGGEITSAYGGGGSGRWEDMPYVITGDLSKIRKANGNPLMINPVDTYFLTNPGQALLIPGGHLTMPGWLPSGTIREVRDNITIYKNKGFTPEDIDRLFIDYYDNSPYIKRETQEMFKKWLWSWLWKNPDLLKGALGEDEGIKARNMKANAFAKGVDSEEIFKDLRTIGIEAAAHKLLDNNDLFDASDVNCVIQEIGRWLATKIRNGSFSEEVTGYYDRKEIEMLAASWGTNGTNRSQAHAEDLEGGSGLQYAAGNLFYAVREGRNRLAEWDRRAETDNPLRELRQGRIQIRHGDFDRRVDVEDRKSIMEYFREHIRMDLSEMIRWTRPELRRMFFVAGVI